MAVSLKVEERPVRPRSLRNQLRHEGKVPAIVNGYQVESTPLSFVGADLEKIMREHGLNTVITMDLAGKKVNTLIKQTQQDTFTHALTHVEFLSVNMTEEQEVEAEVLLVGDAAGVKAGGILAQNLYAVLVSATPDKLPERVEVDVTNLQIGDAITVADIPANADYKIITDGEEQVAAIVEAQVEEEPETTEGAEAAQPEIIGEKTED